MATPHFQVHNGSTISFGNQIIIYINALIFLIYPNCFKFPDCALIISTKNSIISYAMHKKMKYISYKQNILHFTFYLAKSTALVSLITLILICPGYSSSSSTLFAKLCANSIVPASSILSGLTIILISLPA